MQYVSAFMKSCTKSLTIGLFQISYRDVIERSVATWQSHGVTGARSGFDYAKSFFPGLPRSARNDILRGRCFQRRYHILSCCSHPFPRKGPSQIVKLLLQRDTRAVKPGSRDARGFDVDFFKLWGTWYKVLFGAKVIVTGKKGKYYRIGLSEEADAGDAEACEDVLRKYLG